MENTENTFIELALDEIPEEKVLPDGSEHHVQIVKAIVGTSKEGNKTAGQKYILVTFKSSDEPDAKLFTDVFMLPTSDDPASFNQRGRQLKTFFDSFGFDSSSGFNVADLEGLAGPVIVGVEYSAQYGEQNTVKRYL